MRHLMDLDALKYYLSGINKHYSLERVSSLEELSDEYLVLNYVISTLEKLDVHYYFDKDEREIMETVLTWAEISKCGSKEDRARWESKGFNLAIHNIGSAQIYDEIAKASDYKELIILLIKNHGIFGEFIRGEVPIYKIKQFIYDLEDIANNLEQHIRLRSILRGITIAVIAGVEQKIMDNINDEFHDILGKILNDEMIDISYRTRKLFDRPKPEHHDLILGKEFWYFDAALGSFSDEEKVKILKLVKDYDVISFENLMINLYYDYENSKRVNLYKKRIIQSFLNNHQSDQVSLVFKQQHGITYFNFEFSETGEKLIDYCVSAEKSNLLAKESIVMLYDHFDLRLDEFDRLTNGQDYVENMNASSNKMRILDFVTGISALDIGPGGGYLLDRLEDTLNLKRVEGIDISADIVNNLLKRKDKENHTWNVTQGDAFRLRHYYNQGEFDTIIFSSILHEIYSLVELHQKRFNIQNVYSLLRKAYDLLPVGGRIIIRDGIMSNRNKQRIVEFKNKEDIEIFKRYVDLFEGREIKYSYISDNKVQLSENDAMEFLYTYTWGEDSFQHEVKEQFGYLTLKGFKKFIDKELIGSKIIKLESYLLPGYTNHLEYKINYTDLSGKTTTLPDSTCFIVVEKMKE